MNYTQHPLSAAFPAMQADEYQALKDSIENIGVQNPIVLYEGQVIDGWNRYSAAIEVGMPCPTVEFDHCGTDPRDFVEGQNLHRRHLTGSQRAAAVVACAEWRPAHRQKKVEATSTLSETNEQLAKKAGVTTRTITDVKASEKAGLIDAVRDGALTATEAAKVARGDVSKKAKPTLAPVIEQDEEGAPDADELASVAASEKAEADTMRLLLASDAPLADVTDKYKQALLQISRLDARIVGLQNQSLHQIKTIKSLQNKLARLEQPA